MKSFIILGLFIASSFTSLSQTFEKIYQIQNDGNAFQQTNFKAISKSNDGNLLILAERNTGASMWNYTNYDLLIKLDIHGSILSQKVLSNSISSSATRIQSLGIGSGYLISSSGVLSSEGVLLKLDDNLNIEWSKAIGGGNSYYDRIVQAKKLSDGSYITIGTTGTYSNSQASIFLVKLDINGNFIWGKSFGLGGDEDGMDVIEYKGSFYFTGYGSGYAGYTVPLFMKVDKNGNLKYAKVIKGAVGGGGTKKLLKCPQNNNLILAFERQVNYAVEDYVISHVVLTELDTNAQVIWAKEYAGKTADFLRDVDHYKTNGYVISCMADMDTTARSSGWGFVEKPEFSTFVIDNQGNLQSSHRYLDTTSVYEIRDSWGSYLTQMTCLTDGTSFISNSIGPKVNPDNTTKLYLAKHNLNNPANCFINNPMTATTITPQVIDVTASVDILSGGVVINLPLSYTTNNPIFETTSLCEATGIKDYGVNDDFRIYPNPASDQLIISVPDEDLYLVELYNLLGEKINMPKLESSNYPITLDIHNLPEGIYLVQITNTRNNRTSTFKVVKK